MRANHTIEERGFEHFLLTRFNVRGSSDTPRPSNQWLQDRCDLFESICLQHVERQTVKNFRWLIFFDSDTPGSTRQRVEGWRRRSALEIIPVYLDAPFSPSIAAREVAERMEGKRLITTRLDNDDAIAADFMERVQESPFRQDPYVLNFVEGVQIANRRVYSRPYHSNPFISMLENTAEGDPSTVFVLPHNEISALVPVEDARPPHPMWAQIVHGANLANEVVGLRTSSRLVEDWFVLDVAPDESRVKFALDQLGGGLRIILRLLKKPERLRILMRLSRVKNERVSGEVDEGRT